MRVALYLQSDLDEGKDGSNFDADLSAGHEGDMVRWNTEPADGSPAARYELCLRKGEIRLIRADDARMEICFRENEWSEACLSTAHGEIRMSVFTENLILTPAAGATSPGANASTRKTATNTRCRSFWTCCSAPASISPRPGRTSAAGTP